MNMKLNAMYTTERGFIIPRSHFSDNKGLRFAIFEVVETDGTHFTSHHTTLDIKQIRKSLKIIAKEGVTIE